MFIVFVLIIINIVKKIDRTITNAKIPYKPDNLATWKYSKNELSILYVTQKKEIILKIEYLKNK
jgi:hypothetical protein